jgi:hypothetical protein
MLPVESYLLEYSLFICFYSSRKVSGLFFKHKKEALTKGAFQIVAMWFSPVLMQGEITNYGKSLTASLL